MKYALAIEFHRGKYGFIKCVTDGVPVFTTIADAQYFDTQDAALHARAQYTTSSKFKRWDKVEVAEVELGD